MKNEPDTTSFVDTGTNSSVDTHGLEDALKKRVQEDESVHSSNDRRSDSLWDHLQRVALIAERIGSKEGASPVACRLAGLFHDAGKFRGGSYHKDNRPEEEYSVDALMELAENESVPENLLQEVADSIRQLYREDPEPTLLTRVLFDADNLDKLGPLGVANFFIKSGLRGNGMSEDLLYRLTVELTYARHAPHCMATNTGRRWASKRAPETYHFLIGLLTTLRDDNIYDFKIEKVEYDNLILDVVSPSVCSCSGTLQRKIWKVPGIKCTEIHLEHTCSKCEKIHKLRFCSPRLLI